MRKTLIVGLDGLSWRTVLNHHQQFPYMSRMIGGNLPEWRSRMMGVVGPPHSAPSWTTIGTGVHANEHGIYDFNIIDKDGRVGRRHKRDDVDHPFFWEAMAYSGIDVAVFDYYAMLPPLRFNTNIAPSVEFSLTVTFEEMVESIEKQKQHAYDLLLGNDVVMFVSIAIDKAQHISHKLSGSNTERAGLVYRASDIMVEQFANEDIDLILLSDHGLPGKAFIHNTRRVPGHHPDAMIATNKDQPGKLPSVTSEFAGWVIQPYFGAHSAPREFWTTTNDDYSPEEEKDVLDRLEELGYI